MAAPDSTSNSTLPARLNMLSLQTTNATNLMTPCPKMASARTTGRCRLLELPAELRNRVYRDTLCHADDIVLNRATYCEPTLLATCKKLRKEAGSIYYLENRFEVHAPGFEPSVVIRFEQDAKQLVKLNEVDYCIDDTSQTYLWKDLMHWLKAYHDGNVTPLFFGEDDEGDELRTGYVAVKAFDMVKKLKAHMGWQDIEVVMESFKEATVGLVGWQ